MLIKVEKITLLFFLIILFAGCNSSYNNVPFIKTEDFFKNPDRYNYQISPNGNYVAFLKPVNHKLNLFLLNLNNKKEIQLTNINQRDVFNYFWGNDDKIIYVYDSSGGEKYQIYCVDINTKETKSLINDSSLQAVLVDPLVNDKSNILVALNKNSKNIFDVYKLNFIRGELKLVLKKPGNYMGWSTDHNGVIRIVTTTDGVNTGILYRDNENEEFKLSAYSDLRDEFNPLFFSADNKYVYALSNYNRDKIALVKYDFNTQKEIEVVYKNARVDVKSAVYSSVKQKVIFIKYTTVKAQNYYVDKEYQTIDLIIRKKLNKANYEMVSFTDDENKIIIRTYSDKSLGSYYLYTKKTNSLEKLADLSPWINEENMAEMKPISYKSRDNETISGYLSVPVGVKAQNLPVIIFPHGGPWLRDSWGYNNTVQFFCNRGYAVLQMNYRGSKGYGKKFYEAGFKEWGGKIQDDITDGAEWLIKQGIADKEKIAIYGYSFGGYSALMGMIKNPTLYKCGISYCGVINLFGFLSSVPDYWSPFKDMLYETIGNPSKDSTMLANGSPYQNVKKIKQPLFIAQGANDPKVSIKDTDSFVKKLKENKNKVEYFVKENEGHTFLNEENRIELFKQIEKFLSKNIGGRSE